MLQGRGNQALYDPLTGLMIRETFTGKIKSAVKRARSLGECSALLMLDLDHFHVINDVAGHSAGDRLLKAIANLLQERLFEEKECARLGSDEFVILLHNMDADEVQAQAHRLRNEIDALIFESNNQRFAISASIGVVPIRSNSPDSAELIRMAYSACRCAQEENCGVRLFMDNDARIQRRHNEARMLGWVLKAIESGQIELYCQPIVGPQVSCTSLSGEILLRMRNGQGQLISAGELMLLAERHGFSSKLDRLVVTRTLQILSSEQSALDGIRYLAINLSAHSIGNVAFVDFLAEQIRQSGVDGSKLCFEITETAAILDLKATGHLIDMLKGLGCKFALDDFGSGHASYLYLRDLAVDYLKIDGEFIRHMVTDPVNIDLVRAMLDMGKILGKEVIAEFVENNATLKLLEELGMDWVQGYFIGRPMPLLEFLVDQKP